MAVAGANNAGAWIKPPNAQPMSAKRAIIDFMLIKSGAGSD